MNFIKLNMTIMLIGISLIGIKANAAFLDVTSLATVSGNTGVLNLTKKNGDPFQITFSDASLVESILYSNGDDHINQSPSSLGSAIQNEFALSSVDFVDKGGSGNISSSEGSFQFLAVHIGGHKELFFKFLEGVTEFTISKSNSHHGRWDDEDKHGHHGRGHDGKHGHKGGHGIGNWRAFNGSVVVDPPPPNAVPVPAAIWLFGSAVVGFGVTTRKKGKATLQA